MKRLTGFINGFIACLLMVYSFIIFVIYKWARCEDICGFEIKQRYSTNRPKYKYPVKYSYVPPTYKSYSEILADNLDDRLGKIRFASEEMAKEAKNWLIEQIESYKYVSALDFLSHAKMLAPYTYQKYGWSDTNLEEIKSLEPNCFNDCWSLDLPPVSYIVEHSGCDGCVHKGAWEDEVELGYDSPCTVCKRRASDRYEKGVSE